MNEQTSSVIDVATFARKTKWETISDVRTVDKRELVYVTVSHEWTNIVCDWCRDFCPENEMRNNQVMLEQ